MVRHPARAEVVGSLLRLKTPKTAVEAFHGEGHWAVLDDERAESAAEFRRFGFLSSFSDAVRGFSTEDDPIELPNDCVWG